MSSLKSRANHFMDTKTLATDLIGIGIALVVAGFLMAAMAGHASPVQTPHQIAEDGTRQDAATSGTMEPQGPELREGCEPGEWTDWCLGCVNDCLQPDTEEGGE